MSIIHHHFWSSSSESSSPPSSSSSIVSWFGFLVSPQKFVRVSVLFSGSNGLIQHPSIFALLHTVAVSIIIVQHPSALGGNSCELLCPAKEKRDEAKTSTNCIPSYIVTLTPSDRHRHKHAKQLKQYSSGNSRVQPPIRVESSLHRL